MNTVLQIAAGIAGLVLLCYGADFLVRGGVQIAKKFKVTPLVIGLTLVAFATSAPELVVSCDAALQGAGDIALGNVIGSNICNIALILGLSALITPLRVNPNLFKLDVPLMLGASVLLASSSGFPADSTGWKGRSSSRGSSHMWHTASMPHGRAAKR